MTNSGTIMVNQLPLPALLVDWIESGRWPARPNTDAIRQLGLFEHPENVHFMSVPGMQRETEGLLSLFDHNADGRPGTKGREVYGLTRSDPGDPPDVEPLLLDVRLAVTLSVNWDEEGFCLDYRPGLQIPQVVAGVATDPHGLIRWHVVAPDFAEFVEMFCINPAGSADSIDR